MTGRALVVAVPQPCLGLAELPGTRYDAADMSNLLGTRGFAEIRLHDDGVTRQQFIEELKWLRNATVADDLAVVYFAGHGYQVRDTSGDEPDGQDECLVCSDEVLNNDWFRGEYWPHTGEGSWWVTCADTCFAANVFRVAAVDYDEETATADPVVPAMKLLPTPSGAARIWLSAVGEEENAFEITSADGHKCGWYSDQLKQLLTANTNLTYNGLAYRLQRRWEAARAAEYTALACPHIASSEAAEPLRAFRAFAAV